MAIKYSVEPMRVGLGKDKRDAYVGRIQLSDNISTEKLEEQVALRTMLPANVVHTVFSNLIDSVIHFIEEGHGVRLGELGILKPGISTQSSATDDGVKVTHTRIRYIQSKKMRQAVQNLSIRKLADEDEDDEEVADDETTSGGDSTDGGSGTGGNPL